MIKPMSHVREPRVHTGHKHNGVRRACKVLRGYLSQNLAEAKEDVRQLWLTTLQALDTTVKYAQPTFLEWFNNTAVQLGLSRKVRQEVLAIVG